MKTSSFPSAAIVSPGFTLGSILLIVVGTVLRGAAADRFEEIRQLWKDQHYLEAAQSLKEYRNQAYGKIVEADYMLATSLCHLPQYSSDGRKLLRSILYHYPLDLPNRQLVENQIQVCGANTRPPVIFAINVLPVSAGKRAAEERSRVPEVHSSPGVSGKGYYRPRDRDSDGGLAMPSIPVQIVRPIAAKELAARLVPLGNGAVAVDKARRRVDSKSKVGALGPFLIVALPGCNAQPDYLARFLEKYIRFYGKTYDMPPPTNYLTVYLVSSAAELSKLANQLHGIKVSPYSIGYSFRDDLSLVGVVAGEAVGTLAHELFHLMARNNFGDIPPWLDEGLAALYEVSNPWNDDVVGLPNWRGDVLQQLWEKRPTVSNLVTMDWRGFDNETGEYEITQQASNAAMARYFMLYLQDKTTKLREVYRAFRDRKLEDIREDARAESVELLEKVMGKPLAQVDKDFAAWFETQNPAPLHRPAYNPINAPNSTDRKRVAPNSRLDDIPNRANQEAPRK